MILLMALVRIGLFLLGIVLTYVCFLYEDEENLVQSRLEDWWIRLHDTSDRALSLQARFVRGVARSVDNVLSRLFGEEVVSVRSIAVSVCYSVGASLLWVGALWLIVLLILPSFQSELPPFVQFVTGKVVSDFYLYLLAGALLVLAGTLPAVWPKLSWLSASMAIIAICVNELLFLSDRFRTGFASREGGVVSEAGVVLALPLSTLSDLYVLTVTRRVLKMSVESTTLKYALQQLSMGLFAFLLVLGAPFAIYHFTQLVFFSSLTLMNLPSGVLLVSFFAVSLLMLCHRAVWPSILRPLYSAQRARLLSNRKILFSLGIACLGAAFTPSITEAVQFLQKAGKSIVH
jgi:hypothetical protein